MSGVGGAPERSSGTLSPAEHFHQRLVDDLEHLLGRSQAVQYVSGQCLFAHPIGEGTRHTEVHVGFEQRQADLAQRLVYVGLVQPSLAPQAAEHTL